LYRGHHRQVHRRGDEAAWWKKLGVNHGVQAKRSKSGTISIDLLEVKNGDAAV
jgi:hypothetical protein